MNTKPKVAPLAATLIAIGSLAGGAMGQTWNMNFSGTMVESLGDNATHYTIPGNDQIELSFSIDESTPDIGASPFDAIGLGYEYALSGGSVSIGSLQFDITNPAYFTWEHYSGKTILLFSFEHVGMGVTPVNGAVLTTNYDYWIYSIATSQETTSNSLPDVLQGLTTASLVPQNPINPTRHLGWFYDEGKTPEASLSSMSVSQVPEPSSILLVALSGASLLSRRRK